MTLHGRIHKRHIALSFHRMRDSIAANIVNYLFIDGKNNLADVLTKYWDHNDILPSLKPILF